MLHCFLTIDCKSKGQKRQLQQPLSIKERHITMPGRDRACNKVIVHGIKFMYIFEDFAQNYYNLNFDY